MVDYSDTLVSKNRGLIPMKDKKEEYQFLYKEIEYAVRVLRFETYRLKNGATCERGKWVHIENIVKFLQKRYPDRWTSSTILRRVNELPKLNRLRAHPSIKGLYSLC